MVASLTGYLMFNNGASEVAEGVRTKSRETATLDINEIELQAGAETTDRATPSVPPQNPVAPQFLMQDHPAAPTTPEELAWLKRAGFPDRQMVQLLDRMSIAELRVEAARGNLDAQVQLGRKLGRLDSGEEPFDLLKDAVIKGSIYALGVMAEIHAYGSPRYRNYALASAYYQVGALCGDYSMLINNVLIQSSLGPDGTAVAELEARRIFLSLNEERTRIAGQSIIQEMRPGHEEMLRTFYQRWVASRSGSK